MNWVVILKLVWAILWEHVSKQPQKKHLVVAKLLPTLCKTLGSISSTTEVQIGYS